MFSLAVLGIFLQPRTEPNRDRISRKRIFTIVIFTFVVSQYEKLAFVLVYLHANFARKTTHVLHAS